jgi:hypothetical protein
MRPMTDDELNRLFDTLRHENSAAHAETRRHFDVANEATRHEIRLVAESVVHVTEELQRTRTTLDQNTSARPPRHRR